MRLGRERPEELVKRHVVSQRDRRAGVRDRRFDLPAMADDRRIAEQPLDVALAERGHALRVEAVDGGTEAFALAQDREPAEARLEPLEAEPLVDAALVAHGPAPLLVVVGDVERVGRRPAARRLYYSTTSTWTTPSSTVTRYVSTGSKAGSESGRPLVRSNADPCRGQITRQSSSSHSP